MVRNSWAKTGITGAFTDRALLDEAQVMEDLGSLYPASTAKEERIVEAEEPREIIDLEDVDLEDEVLDGIISDMKGHDADWRSGKYPAKNIAKKGGGKNKKLGRPAKKAQRRFSVEPEPEMDLEPDTDVEAVEVEREEAPIRIVYRTRNATKGKAKALPPPPPVLDQYSSDDEEEVEDSEFTPSTSQGGSMATSTLEKEGGCEATSEVQSEGEGGTASVSKLGTVVPIGRDDRRQIPLTPTQGSQSGSDGSVVKQMRELFFK
jgi:hypothetical protein